MLPGSGFPARRASVTFWKEDKPATTRPAVVLQAERGPGPVTPALCQFRPAAALALRPDLRCVSAGPPLPAFRLVAGF